MSTPSTAEKIQIREQRVVDCTVQVARAKADLAEAEEALADARADLVEALRDVPAIGNRHATFIANALDAVLAHRGKDVPIADAVTLLVLRVELSRLLTEAAR